MVNLSNFFRHKLGYDTFLLDMCNNECVLTNIFLKKSPQKSWENMRKSRMATAWKGIKFLNTEKGWSHDGGT